jgi:hypothetical protein
MGLFGDTIRDARRPVTGGWVRRSAMNEIEAAPDEAVAQDSMSSGMQTVFRFQKEGQSLPREASSQLAGGVTRPPAGDQFAGGNNRLRADGPLSAGTEVEIPEPSAIHVVNSDVSFKGDKRTGELATGQEEHTRSSKVVAAKVKSESFSLQSVVSPESMESELGHQQHQSGIPEDREQLVSVSSDAFLSRPPGPGAPSETFPSPAAVAPSYPTRLPQRPGEAMPAATPAQPLESAHAAASALDPRASPPPVASLAEAAPATPGELGHAYAREFTPPPAAAPRPSRAVLDPAGSRSDRSAFAATAPAPRHAERSEPSLVIGRIDVVVVANAAPASAPASPRADSGFLSRNYLKRL